MAILTKPRQPDAHWYTRDAKSMHRVPTGDGADRPTHLGDAKKFMLLPSVTTILNIFAKEGLNKWKNKQVALAALRLLHGKPKRREPQDHLVDAILDEAFRQVDDAANFGTAIHKVLEQALGGEAIDPTWTIQLPNVTEPVAVSTLAQPVLDWITSKGLTVVGREVTLANTEHGFGGTMDTAFTFGKSGFGVLDFKTRKTEPGKPIKPYEFQASQIVAYGATYWSQKLGWPVEQVLAKMHGANIFISSTEPGRVEIIRYTPELLQQEWMIVQIAAIAWRYINGYDPRDKAHNLLPIPDAEVLAQARSSGVSDTPPLALPISEGSTPPPNKEKPKEAKKEARKRPANVPPPKPGDLDAYSTEEEVSGAFKAANEKIKVGTAKVTGVKDAKNIVSMPHEPAPPKKSGKAYTLDFGAHKGKTLDEVPTEYLKKLIVQPSVLAKHPGLEKELKKFLA